MCSCVKLFFYVLLKSFGVSDSKVCFSVISLILYLLQTELRFTGILNMLSRLACSEARLCFICVTNKVWS